MNIKEFKGTDRIFYTLEMHAEDAIILSFNYFKPITGEGKREDGSSFTWYRWSINFTHQKQEYEYASIFLPQWFSESVEKLLSEATEEESEVKQYDWKISRPPQKNPRTKRLYAAWKIEPFVTLKETQQKIIEIDGPSIEGHTIDSTDLALTEHEFSLLYRDVIFEKSYGEEKVKEFLINNIPDIAEERAEMLVDVLVNPDGYVLKEFVEKYGAQWVK